MKYAIIVNLGTRNENILFGGLFGARLMFNKIIKCSDVIGAYILDRETGVVEEFYGVI